jgi:ATP-binding cassette, subfamily C, type I secretion system permease/ATPase
LQAVSYATSDSAPALIKQVNLDIEAGESLGVIGRSGCGKTLLVRLLLGILQPRSGAVHLDDTNLSHWDRNLMGRYLGYLPQGAELLSGSIADNIARLGVGNPSLVVLDEPNANLDTAGQVALADTLKQLKHLGVTVVVVAHRAHLLWQLDRLLVLKDGKLEICHRGAPDPGRLPPIGPARSRGNALSVSLSPLR